MTEQPTVEALPDFTAFYRNEFRSVAGLAYVLSGNASVAEDLTQEAFAAAFDRWSEIGRMDKPGAWVRRVVANKSVSRLRRLRSEVRAVIRLFGDRRSEPELSEEAIVVVDAVRRLSTRQAEVVGLHYFADLPIRDIAAAIGCSGETVRTHLKRARAKLARTLGDLT